MKTPYSLILLMLCFCPVASAGEAQSASTSHHTYGTIVAAWYKDHRAAILTAANMKIQSTLEDDRYCVQSKTPLGNWSYVMKETIEVDGADVRIKYRLSNKLETSFSRNSVTITIAPTSDGCDVKMSMDQRVDKLLVLSRILKRSQQESINAVTAYLCEHLK